MTPITLPDSGESSGLNKAIEPEQAATVSVDAKPIAVEAHEAASDDDTGIEEALEDPLEGFEFIDPAEVDVPAGPDDSSGDVPLMDLNTAVEQIPEGLRKEMADLLRAEFREVIRWKPERT